MGSAITWESLSPSQRCALAWAALHPDAAKPTGYGAVRISERTWTSLENRGLVEMSRRSYTWTATAIGRALLPIERPEAGDG